MGYDFIETELGKFIEIVTKKCDTSAVNNTNYISTENMLPNRQGVTISSSIPDSNKFNSFEVGDTLFSNIRTYFKKVWFATFDGGASPDVLVFRTTQKTLTNEYLNLILSNDDFIDYSHLTSKGAKMPRGDKGAMLNYKIKIPPLNYQNKCTKIIFTLNKKIDNNNQINKTLEQMAQALFKSWFVDFEPVKAKIAVLEAGGSQDESTLAAMTTISGKDADSLVIFEQEQPAKFAELKTTAELFPSAMQESELGEIPEGWAVSELSSVALLNTSSWTKKTAPEILNYVDLANTKWGVINSVEKYNFADAPSRARRILKPLDTIVGTVRPGNGSYAYINKEGLTGSTGFAVLTPKQAIFSEYIYLCATSKESIERLAHLADGGAYPAVNADVVVSTQCVIPSKQKELESLLREFSSKVKTVFSYKSYNFEQNIILIDLRDTLLPKLLSGEITLPEAEQAVSEAENV